MDVGRLLEAVREVCPRGLWSQGVKLARDGAVRREPGGAGEIVVRVPAPGRAVAQTVVLYPREGEWECDCDGRFDACAHVAAAVIALSQPPGDAAVEEGATLHYRFERGPGDHLLLRREVVGDGPLHPTQIDLAVGRALGGVLPGDVRQIELSQVPPVLAALAGSDRVSLDGAPVAVSSEPVLPRGVVTDRGDGVRLAVVAHPTVAVVGDGVALCKDTLRPLGHTAVAGARWEALPLVRDYAPAELGELVTSMLPALERDIPIDVRTRRLPGVTRAARPRIHFAIDSDGARLSVLPTLVYGDPPLARIDGDRMVQLPPRTRGEPVPPAPVRDRRAEASVLAALRDRLNMVPGRRITVTGAEARAMADKLRAFQRGDDPDAALEALHDIPLVPRLSVRDEDGDEAAAFDLWFETEEPVGGQIRRVSGAAVMAAWQGGLELVPLDDGGWAPLPDGFLERHGRRVLDLLAARKEDGRVAPVTVPSLAALCDEMDQPRPAAARRLAALLGDGGRIPPAPLPDGFRGSLRPYQQAGVDWLAFLRSAGFGAVLADDMGLGKTVQALAVLPAGSLVVCPTSVLHNWAAEIARFRPDLRVCVYHGPRRALDPDAGVVVTTYALLRIDRDELTARRWSALVLDEAQAVKNPDSQSAHAAAAIEADFRLALSGTPVENRLEELWSACHQTNPGLLGGRSDFQRRFASPIAAGNPQAAQLLRDKIRPFVLRRLKRDVAPELPPRTDAVLSVELDEAERATYDAVRAATRADLVARLSSGKGVLEALEALLRLRQAACHPGLLPGQEAATSSKVTSLLEALESAVSGGHKALVFSQWTSLLDLVEPHLRAAEIGFTRLDGSTTDRAGVVAAFQDPAGPPVLIASLKAGGTGLNLTAADHVFILDPWWNPAAEDQAADRAHRIGQDRPVMVYRLVSRDTVEERILALQERKRALADVALGEAGQAAGLTREDLLALID
ncbi:MAG TPA: DEAD/DEAH box helicase [Kofleriaceae bacterium]|nr:DEAD/DEAH box helicase [Kofleriaceae bacterium]